MNRFLSGESRRCGIPAGRGTRAARARGLRSAMLVALASVAAACSPEVQPPSPPPLASGNDWREFTGTWNAAGSRRMLAFGADRRVSTIDLSGTLLLAGAERPGVGFRSEVIALVDSATGMVGRGVWTDERGEQVFTELKGEGTAQNNRITGTIVGGTGRYAGVTGSYEFSWRFVLEAEDGSIQGSATGLKGRVRPGPPATAGSKP